METMRSTKATSGIRTYRSCSITGALLSSTPVNRGSCIARRFYTLIINELHTALEETDGAGKKGKEVVNGNRLLALCTYVPLQLEKQRCRE